MEIFPQKVTRLRKSAREVLSERMIIEDTGSHGNLVLHRFEKAWPQLNNVVLNDCHLIRNIVKLISAINKVLSSFPHN